MFDDVIEPIHILCPDSSGQAQLAERALAATASKMGEIEYNHTHNLSLRGWAIVCRSEGIGRFETILIQINMHALQEV